MKMNIYDMVDKIRNQDDFVLFLKKLSQNLIEKPDDWENNDLKNYLSGLEGYCFDKKREKLTWGSFAEILLAARVYE